MSDDTKPTDNPDPKNIGLPGQGQFDELAKLLMLRTNGRAAIVMVIGEIKGLSISTRDPAMLLQLPTILRDVANRIEADQRAAAQS